MDLVPGLDHEFKGLAKEDYGDDNGPRKRPELTLEQKALQFVDSYESGTLTDTEKFLRDVRNRMSFHGLPEEWKPKIKTDGQR